MVIRTVLRSWRLSRRGVAAVGPTREAADRDGEPGGSSPGVRDCSASRDFAGAIVHIAARKVGQSSERGKQLIEQLELAIEDLEETQGAEEAKAEIAAPEAMK